MKVIAKIISKEKIIEGIYKFSVNAPEIAKKAVPGQFLEIKVSDKTTDPFLRRPISIYNVNGENVEFIFQVRGKGTYLLSEKNEGDMLDILGPLGNGVFSLNGVSNVAIIGGGIGIYPLYYLAKLLKDKANVVTYLGFRNKELVTLEKEFENVSNKLILSTDDGSYKNKGYSIDYLKKNCLDNKPDMIYACGPAGMLKAVSLFAKENNIPCEISLEERMGCGIGACLGCATKIIENDEIRFGHVCKDGPVFNVNNVEI